MNVTVKFHKQIDLTNLGKFEKHCSQNIYDDYSEEKRRRMLLKAAVKKEVPQRGGVYFLLEDGVVIYVGRSIDLQARLISHVSTSEMMGRVDGIAVQYVDDLPMQYVIEAVAIAEFMPEFNRLGKTV